MKNILLLLLASLIFSCSYDSKNEEEDQDTSLNEQLFVELGGEKQYVEIISSSEKNPVMLFVHGGPAWPQTPQLRYFNAELSDHYTLVIWEQRGAGKNYKINPTSDNLTLDQIVQDGNELAGWLKEKFHKEKIYLAGYSWGSLVGVMMAEQHPENYHAYLGISQFINKSEGMKISRNWVKERAFQEDDQLALQKIDSLEHPDYFEDEHERFFQQYLLVNKFGGAVYDTANLAEVEKAENFYEDYQDYDWYAAWSASSKSLQDTFYQIDVRNITELKVPIYLFEGRHDWNVPAVLAEA